jgi:hypothetical protein
MSCQDAPSDRAVATARSKFACAFSMPPAHVAHAVRALTFFANTHQVYLSVVASPGSCRIDWPPACPRAPQALSPRARANVNAVSVILGCRQAPRGRSSPHQATHCGRPFGPACGSSGAVQSTPLKDPAGPRKEVEPVRALPQILPTIPHRINRLHTPRMDSRRRGVQRPKDRVAPLSGVPSPCSSKRGSKFASGCAVISGVGI